MTVQRTSMYNLSDLLGVMPPIPSMPFSMWYQCCVINMGVFHWLEGKQKVLSLILGFSNYVQGSYQVLTGIKLKVGYGVA